VALASALEVWPWPKIQGQNLGRLQNSPLTSIDWSTVTGVNIIFQDPRSLRSGFVNITGRDTKVTPLKLFCYWNSAWVQQMQITQKHTPITCRLYSAQLAHK